MSNLKQNVDVVLDTADGRIRGQRAGGVQQFLRVRYAESPIENRRFALPQPKQAWDGILDATQVGPIPPQLPSRLEKAMGIYPGRQDEDCLHLDIWSPMAGVNNAPVLVFLHGGAFMTGGGSLSCYDGSALCEHTGMVVVNISYRLGVLGFLPVSGISSANLGIQDQILALRWVRENIATFGGNPDCITLAGQSAGGLSIAILLATPIGPELFDRAILMSAPLGVPLLNLAQAEVNSDIFLNALGAEKNDKSAILAKPISDVLRAQVAVLTESVRADGDITPPFMPVIDGDIVKEDPIEALKRGNGKWCDIIVGTTRDEMNAFYIDDPHLEKNASAILHSLKASQKNKVVAARETQHSSAIDALSVYQTEDTFERDSIGLAQAQESHGKAAFAYRFDWTPPQNKIGACHCIDLPFLLGKPDVWASAPMLSGAPETEIASMRSQFQNAFAQFARNGSPNGTGLTEWPRYGQTKTIQHFDYAEGVGSLSGDTFDSNQKDASNANT